MFPQRLASSQARLLAGALALIILLVALVTCTQGTPASRNHVAADVYPLFVQITFANDTTYDQAVALLQHAGHFPYPWNCDDPPNLTPPPTAQQQADFNAGHTLLISYPTPEELNQLAASDRVTSIDTVTLTLCSGIG